jgi:hypothetical protein
MKKGHGSVSDHITQQDTGKGIDIVKIPVPMG